MSQGCQKNDKPTISRKCLSQASNDRVGWQNFHNNIILKKELYVGNVPNLFQFSPSSPSPPTSMLTSETLDRMWQQKKTAKIEDGGRGLLSRALHRNAILVANFLYISLFCRLV